MSTFWRMGDRFVIARVVRCCRQGSLLYETTLWFAIKLWFAINRSGPLFGSGAASGYGSAVTPLQNYSAVWGSIPGDQQDQLKRNYATLEIRDGSSINSMTTLGTIRGNAPQVENAIAGLEADSLSSDPSLNTEVGVLNKINAATVISLRNTQDSNKLLASVLEQQLAGEKARRDAEAKSINNQIAFQTQQTGLIQQHLTGTTGVLTGFNIP